MTIRDIMELKIGDMDDDSRQRWREILDNEQASETVSEDQYTIWPDDSDEEEV